MLPNDIQTGMIVSCFIIWVFDQRHLKLFFQIRKTFLFISGHHKDFFDPRFPKLPDLPLDQNFSVYIQECFRRLI